MMRLERGGREILSETAVVYGWSEHMGIHGLAAAVNSLRAAGAEDIGAGIQITYPPRIDRTAVYRTEKNVRAECKKRGIKLLESRLFEQPLIKVPSAAVSCIAEVKGRKAGGVQKSFAGMDIVLSKWVGMDGMLLVSRERADDLKKRFTPSFIRQIMSYEKELFAGAETVIAKDMDVLEVRQITRGGIFAALWELASELGTGLDLDMKCFSILQETVEVCEYFRLNPYQLTSAGSFLFVTEDGEALKEAFLKEGIMASVIGKTADGRGKIIRNGEDMRFIDRPAPDEIWKLYLEE